MQLDRNINKSGKGKYALIKLRDIPTDPRTPQELAQAILDNPECVDFGVKGSESEFFVTKLKDKYAAPSLHAYAKAAANDDTEWSNEVTDMAIRAENHPNQNEPN